MNHDEHARLSLAGVAAGCWMVLGLQAILSLGSAGDVRSSTQNRRRILLQLVLFVMGVSLMVIAIKF